MKICRIPIFIPQLGCPHACSYCNQREITGITQIPKPESLHGLIEQHLSTFSANTHAEIAFFGGTFTALPSVLQEAYLKQAAAYIHNASPVQSIRFSTRPDDIDPQMLPLYKKYGVSAIELGAQTLQDTILADIGRGHTRIDVQKAAFLIREAGIRLGLQMMIGLPHDSLEKSIDTAQTFIRFGAQETRIYPTLVIENTLLAQQYRQGLYQPLSLQEAANWCSELIPIFEEANVDILRVGLHPSEGLISHQAHIAGPFHSSFRSLAESVIWGKIWQKDFAPTFGKSFSKPKHLKIWVNPKQVNVAYGHHGENGRFLKQSFCKVSIYPQADLLGRNYIYDIR